MERVQIKNYSKDIDDLYITSFPVEERVDLGELMTLKTGIYYGYYENNQLLGIAFIAEYKDIQNLMYLAVNPDYRNQGIGGKILKDLESDKRLVIDIEYPLDSDIKMRRHQFYLRHHFIDTPLQHSWNQVRYLTMIRNGSIDEEEYRDFWAHVWNI